MGCKNCDNGQDCAGGGGGKMAPNLPQAVCEDNSNPINIRNGNIAQPVLLGKGLGVPIKPQGGQGLALSGNGLGCGGALIAQPYDKANPAHFMKPYVMGMPTPQAQLGGGGGGQMVPNPPPPQVQNIFVPNVIAGGKFSVATPIGQIGGGGPVVPQFQVVQPVFGGGHFAVPFALGQVPGTKGFSRSLPEGGGGEAQDKECLCHPEGGHRCKPPYHCCPLVKLLSIKTRYNPQRKYQGLYSFSCDINATVELKQVCQPDKPNIPCPKVWVAFISFCKRDISYCYCQANGSFTHYKAQHDWLIDTSAKGPNNGKGRVTYGELGTYENARLLSPGGKVEMNFHDQPENLLFRPSLNQILFFITGKTEFRTFIAVQCEMCKDDNAMKKECRWYAIERLDWEINWDAHYMLWGDICNGRGNFTFWHWYIEGAIHSSSIETKFCEEIVDPNLANLCNQPVCNSPEANVENLQNSPCPYLNRLQGRQRIRIDRGWLPDEYYKSYRTQLPFPAGLFRI